MKHLGRVGNCTALTTSMEKICAKTKPLSLKPFNPFIFFPGLPCHIFGDSSQGTKASRIFCALGISIPIRNLDSRKESLRPQRDPSVVCLMLTALFVVKNGVQGCPDHTLQR